MKPVLPLFEILQVFITHITCQKNNQLHLAFIYHHNHIYERITSSGSQKNLRKNSGAERRFV
jgi:hypothetical protein